MTGAAQESGRCRDDLDQRAHNPTLFALSAGLTAAFLTLVGTCGPDLREHLSIDIAAITVLAMLQMAGAFAGSLLAGAASRPPLRLASAAAFTAVAIAVAAISHSYLLTAAVLAVAGMSVFAVTTLTQTAVLRGAAVSAVPGARSRALSYFHVWGGIGGAFFPLLVAALLAVGGPWQLAFAAVALAYAGYAIANRHIGPLPGVLQPPAARRRQRLSIRFWVAATPVIVTGAQNLLPLYLTLLLVDEFGSGKALASASVSAYAFGLLGARLVGTRLLAQTGPERQLDFSAVALCCGAVLFVLAPSTATVFPAVMLVGIGSGQMAPLMMARATGALGDAAQATKLTFGLGAVAQIAFPAGIALLLLVVDLHHALAMMIVPLSAVSAFGIRFTAPRRWRDAGS